MVTLNRVLIAIDALIQTLKKKKLIDNKKVIIVFQQVFGDSIIISDSLKEYTKIFPAQKGYTIKFLALPSVLSFMKDNLNFPNEIEYEKFDFKRFLSDYKYYRASKKKYSKNASIFFLRYFTFF